MKVQLIKFFLSTLFWIFISIKVTSAEVIKKIEILGNDRISNDTIQLFGKVSINDKIDSDDLNQILKRLYDTNYFKNVSVSLNDNYVS